MIKLSRNALFLEKKPVICWAFKTITQLPVFTKETVKSSTEETPQVYFLGWKTELKYLRTRYQESKEHSIPLNAVVTPTFITKSRETRGMGTDWQHSWQKTIQVTPFLHFSLILGMDCSTIPLRCGCPPILGYQRSARLTFPATTSNCNTILIYSVKRIKSHGLN